MLGTNDCKAVYHASAHVIGKGMERCLNVLKKTVLPERILLISPVLFGEDVWKPEKDLEFDMTSVLTCSQLKSEYAQIAKSTGTAFLNASEYTTASDIDDEHLTEAGHAALAEAIFGKLIEMKVL
jgi:lysophospholipase L1-like esterase